MMKQKEFSTENPGPVTNSIQRAPEREEIKRLTDYYDLAKLFR
jgi:hypothetical protein